MTTTTTATPQPRMTDGRRKLCFALCLVTIIVALLDMNIVSAASVPIVRDLDPVNGVNRLPWLITAYSLAATATLPLYGKLCDLYGAKRVYLGSVGTFLIGSVLCGAAQSMDQLIAFRALQGAGGGGLMSVTMVVLAQLMEPGEEEKGGGVGGIVGGAAMAVGPLVGALFADDLNWRWIFYVNVPLGLAVLVGSAVMLKLPAGSGGRGIDFLGAGLAAGFTTVVLLVSDWGGEKYAWSSPVVLGLIAGAVAALVLFLWRQRTAAEPILPLSLFRVPALRTGFVVQFLVGVSLMGSVVYMMVYLQTARGLSAIDASLFLIPMAFGMTVSGIVVTKLTDRGWKARTFLVSGSACAAVAMGLLALTSADTSLWVLRAELLVLGVGFGQMVGQLIMVVQANSPEQQLGVATTALRFFQTVGNAVGASVFGALLTHRFASGMPGVSLSGVSSLTGERHSQAVSVFVDATDLIFVTAAGIMVLAVLALLRLRAARSASAPSAPLPADA
jgi:EmrB/QacA subfamily drug resistance transporter